MFILDYRDKRPIYEQIIDKLSELMIHNVLKPEDKLPSVRSLAMDLSINPNTIQRAYLELERLGYIYSVKGKGSFVCDLSGLRDEQKYLIMEELRVLLKRAKKMDIHKQSIIHIVQEEYEQEVINDTSK